MRATEQLCIAQTKASLLSRTTLCSDQRHTLLQDAQEQENKKRDERRVNYVLNYVCKVGSININ